MRKIKEVLRLKHEKNLGIKKIAGSCSIGNGTVSDYLQRAKAAGLSWPLDPELDDAAIEQKLFPLPQKKTKDDRPEPDWSDFHKELKRKGVTQFLLWQEYKEINPEGYQYSWFCDLYRKWSGKVDLVMRQEHRAGDKLFVDYAGQTIPIINRATGEIKQAQIFVAVLGASNYTYAEATWTQSLPDWINSHVRAFSFFGGVPEVVVPDNLKSGVKKACYYEPDINPTYNDLATHYDTIIFPARARKPRDKAKVETGVLLVERWILASLRNHTFFSLAELNQAIRGLLERLNQRSFKKMPGCRAEMFESLDRPALKPLPEQPYQFANWKKAAVNIDYHLEVDGHYYSVPFQLVGKKVDVRFTERTVECFFKSKRVAAHKRSYQKGWHTTVKEHMPPRHQKYAKWTPERFLRWSRKIGPRTAEVAEKVLNSRSYPQQAYRSVLGILRLGQGYTEQRLEAACNRALAIGTVSYRSIKSILENGLDQRPLPERENQSKSIQHINIRGKKYYH
jgi:transposase